MYILVGARYGILFFFTVFCRDRKLQIFLGKHVFVDLVCFTIPAECTQWFCTFYRFEANFFFLVQSMSTYQSQLYIYIFVLWLHIRIPLIPNLINLQKIEIYPSNQWSWYLGWVLIFWELTFLITTVAVSWTYFTLH